jgi:Flp pilus assembly protein TadG
MTQQRARLRRCRGDEGVALIETAIIALPFFILVFGLLEFGVVFKSYLSLSSAVNTSARGASTFGSQGDADYHILRRINESASALGRSNITRIVIWHASGPTDSPPAGCVGGTATSGSGAPLYTGACNVYDVDDFAWAVADFDCDSSDGGPDDDNWCPSDRKDYLASGGGLPYGTDYIGVYVEVDHQLLTGLWGSEMTMSEYVVTRIEAQGLNQEP